MKPAKFALADYFKERSTTISPVYLRFLNEPSEDQYEMPLLARVPPHVFEPDDAPFYDPELMDIVSRLVFALNKNQPAKDKILLYIPNHSNGNDRRMIVYGSVSNTLSATRIVGDIFAAYSNDELMAVNPEKLAAEEFERRLERVRPDGDAALETNFNNLLYAALRSKRKEQEAHLKINDVREDPDRYDWITFREKIGDFSLSQKIAYATLERFLKKYDIALVTNAYNPAQVEIVSADPLKQRLGWHIASWAQSRIDDGHIFGRRNLKIQLGSAARAVSRSQKGNIHFETGLCICLP